ncbi:hypothetical protein EXIGLDRAFT_722190 [Exidia glandulosa HHB12029]|uniref:Uncharacterized protein n=1 Tax=Exidia glandulosa HHB12029 TaxID=1314781 RepID=A0A165FDG0_EXIGL|nr:hypothetical protein EXIGLDRAFT_722190 [Exidia glandulosa HHB12029]
MRLTILAVAGAAALATARNVTIDDADARWTYGAFAPVSPGQPCNDCISQPDPQQAMNQTWHDTTAEATATLTFNGTGVTIYTICPGRHVNGTYAANLSFDLDGVGNGTFKQVMPGCLSNEYNFQVYTVKGLSLQSHVIAVTNHPGTGPFPLSDLLIDYAIVTDDTSSNSSSFPVAAVVVPIIAIVAVACAGLYWFMRRRRSVRQVRRYDAEPNPFKTPSLTSFPLTDTTTSVHVQGRNSSHDFTHSPAGQHDPELQAAFAVVAARSRSSVQFAPPPQPLRADNTPFSRDRKRPPPVHEYDDDASHPPAYGAS